MMWQEPVYGRRDSGGPALECPKKCVRIQSQRRLFCTFRLGCPVVRQTVNRFFSPLPLVARGDYFGV